VTVVELCLLSLVLLQDKSTELTTVERAAFPSDAIKLFNVLLYDALRRYSLLNALLYIRDVKPPSTSYFMPNYLLCCHETQER
jgi:hypothetical protein